jgi:NAD(P)H-hydrate epimerase
MEGRLVDRVKKIPALPLRDACANKGDCGRVLIVGGSRGMSGAPSLAAQAAYRAGAGLVRVALPESIWDIVAGHCAEVMTTGLPQTKDGTLALRAHKPLLEAIEWADVVVLGPGMGQAKETQALIQKILPEISRPLVLDADGLNAFSGNLAALKRSCKTRPRVLTPHPGEMSRLLGVKTSAIQSDRTAAASDCAEASGAVVLLKGSGTLVCDGASLYENKTGNPGMATGGTGDVLSGLIAALIGQDLSVFDAACLGAHLHGLAGDLAAKHLGVWSMQAGDVISALPGAFLAAAKSQGLSAMGAAL